jgi:hypothetical protein
MENEFPSLMAAELVTGHGISLSNAELKRKLRATLRTVFDSFQRGVSLAQTNDSKVPERVGDKGGVRFDGPSATWE